MKKKLIALSVLIMTISSIYWAYKKYRFETLESNEIQALIKLVPEMKIFDIADLKKSWPRYQFDVDTVFREKKQATKYVNIDTVGMRHSYDNDGYINVLMIGGSTMFGYGVPDNYSIPSMFNKLQSRYRAYNYGRGGYYSELETKLILKLLREGQRPVEIIVLSGLNDGKNNPLYSQELSFLFDSFNYNKYDYLLAGIGSVLPAKSTGSINIEENPNYYHDLDQWFDSYLRNFAQINYLKEAYGYRLNIFIQPIPGYDNSYAQHPLLQNVATDFHRYQNKKYEVIKNRIEELRKVANVCDLSSSLREYKLFPFVDGTHYTPTVNALIANRMLRFIESGVCDARLNTDEITPEISTKLGF